VSRLTNEYLDSLQTTTPLDKTLAALRQDAINRFKAGDKTAAKTYFKEGVVDAIKNAHKDSILDTALDGTLRGIRLVSPVGFEADLDRVIGYVLKQAKLR